MLHLSVHLLPHVVQNTHTTFPHAHTISNHSTSTHVLRYLQIAARQAGSLEVLLIKVQQRG